MLRYLYLILLFFPTSKGQAQVDPDSERIFLLRFQHGLILSESFIAYPNAERWFFSLDQLSESLSLGFDISPEAEMLKGFIREATNRFEINVKDCRVLLKDVEQSYDCASAFFYEEELFVTHDLIEQWFDLVFKINPFKSEVIIQSKHKFPIEEKIERSKKTPGSLNLSTKDKENVDKMPPELWGGSVLSQQWAFLEKSDARSSSLDSKLSFQALGFSVFASQLKTDEQESNYVQMQRASRDKGAFGLRDIKLLDQSSPSVELLYPAKQTRGVLLSSFPLDFGGSLGSKSLDGDLLQGWEVELYYLSVLIDRKDSSDSGRYLFENIPVQYGRNEYRLVFYGPHGEKREETRVLNIDNFFQEKSAFNYYLFQGKDSDDVSLSSLRGDYGLLKNLSISGQYVQSQDDFNEVSKYFGLSLLGYTDIFSYQVSSFKEMNGGNAEQIKLFTELSEIRLKLDYISFSAFNSPWVEQQYSSAPKDEAKFDLTYAFKSFPLRINTSAKKIEFVSTRIQDEFAFKLGTYVLGTNLNLSHIITKDQTESKSIEFNANKTVGRNNLRFKTSRDEEEWKSFEFNYRYKLNPRTNLRLQLAKDFSSDVTSCQFSASREFEKINLSIDAFYDTNDNYSLGSYLNYSLAMSGFYSPHFRGRDLSRQSFLRVRSFLDENLNAKYDIGEEALEGVLLKINKGSKKFKTDEDGFVIIDSLPVNTTIRLSIDEISLPEPSYYPSKASAYLQLSAGKVYEYAMPVIALGEIDGFVFNKTRNKNQKRVPIELFNLEGQLVAKQYTDSDGYFVFEKIRPGQYRLLVSEDYLKTKSLSIKNKAHVFEVKGKGGYLDEVYFELF